MTTNRSTADGPARRTLEPRSWPRPPGLALLGLALLGLVQTGCVSDGCSTCGFGNAVTNTVRAVTAPVKAFGAAIFHKKSCGGGADCGCGSGADGGVVVDQGIPVVPAIPVVPGSISVPGSGTLVPPPALESEPTQLKPLDSQPANPTSGTGGAATKSSTSRSTPAINSRSNYTTSLPRNGSVARRGSEADQALAKSSNRLTEPAVSADMLDNIIIPPVDLSSEVTRKAMSTPSTTTPSSAPVTNPAAANPPATVAPGPAEKLSAEDGAALVLPPINAVSAYQAPGLRRFSPVAPLITGGSAPSLEGLDWLKERGCKTLIDLRKSSEVEPNFVDAVNDRGMVYISLPILANSLDSSRLARFDDLISRTENRPLFFCDADGTRSALAWYIHQRVVGQEDPQGAQSKAEELGLGAAEVKLAEDYLATQKPKAKAAMAKMAMAHPSSEPKPAEPAPSTTHIESTPPALPEAPDPPAGGVKPAVAPASLDEATPMLPGEDRPQASRVPNPIYRDPSAWKPVAVLVLTSIGVPLAFWSRTMFSEYRQDRRRARASLPGSKPRSLDSPVGSDA
jgi:protein tyrosine phosphatase (PTP) superfamily phosphohydrolase (DUF442 family)